MKKPAKEMRNSELKIEVCHRFDQKHALLALIDLSSRPAVYLKSGVEQPGSSLGS